jgi:hypothetical protein
MSEQISYVGDTGGDAYLDVTFYTGFHEGVETDFVKIAVPGDKTLTIDTMVEESHMRRFARQWEAYKGYRDLKGHPVAEWDDIPDSLKTELLYQGFKFVEQVAGAPDAAFARMMGGPQIRTKAQSFLNRGKVNADEVISKQADQISELQEKMQILMDALNANAPAEKPKRGRKPMVTDDPTELDPPISEE